MPHFVYKARDSQGLLVTGGLDAVGPAELRTALSERGLIPVSIQAATRGFLTTFLEKLTKKGVKPEEVLVMSRQFYTLFKAGMSMEAVLGTLARQTDNPTLKDALQRIRSGVSSGTGLSKSFAEYPGIFGDLYISMLAAGEEAGILEVVLKNLCGLLEKEMEIKSSVGSATLYPKIVIFVLVGAFMVIMTFVIPKFASFFAHFDAELPLPTRIMMGVSDFMRGYWYVIALVAGVGWFIFKRYSRTARGKIKIGELAFKLPVFGMLGIKVANSRFCHILSALYRSGLPMTRCLEITSGTIENGAFHREVQILMSEVTKGKTISSSMAGCRYFTPVIVDATAVGEQTGSLDEMLEAMGGHYDMEVSHTIKNLATLLEPILLFFIFGMVTLFALAIFLPIWGMSKAVSGH